MSDWKDLYSEVKKRKESALNKKDVVNAVEKYGKILAIKGRFEKLEKVIPHMYACEKKIINPEEIEEYDLTQYDIVFIGCPGENIPTPALIKIKDYVDLNGGYLITTDWALRTIVENLFPGFVRWNEKKTNESIVSCQILEPNHPFLEDLVSEIQQDKWGKKGLKKDEFKWWLETKSFPIQILNSKAVHTLIISWEIRDNWGEAPVLVYFDHGKSGGRIIHMISHAHLQKGEAKDKYASALILTNILDEKISKKLGISKSQTSGYVTDWESTQTQSKQNSLEKPLEDQETFGSPRQDNYLNPSMSRVFELTETSQIIEISVSDLSFESKCALCGHDIVEYEGIIYACKACGAPYHEKCLHEQINEGICKKCGRILLW